MENRTEIISFSWLRSEISTAFTCAPTHPSISAIHSGCIRNISPGGGGRKISQHLAKHPHLINGQELREHVSRRAICAIDQHIPRIAKQYAIFQQKLIVFKG